MPKDNTRLGLLMMIGFCILAPASDAFAKILGDGIPVLQVVIARFMVQLLLIRRSLWTRRQDTWMRGDRVGLVILRSALLLLAVTFLFLSLRYLPLADAIAIAYVMPFLVLGVGWLTGDRASPLALGLCLLGFVGTLMVVQPSFSEIGWPALLPIAVAIFFTGFMFITRKISKYIDPIDLQAANGICAMAILLPIAIFGQAMEIPILTIVSVSNIELLYLFGVGILGTLAHLMMTWALRFASAPTVAPIQYLEIPFATLYGWLIFKDFPNGLAALGIVITITAGLLVLRYSKNSIT
jgi:drug/metabolite transporter (DMT)-like permease|tara:strand:- start:2571 stop:3458 length:888 start_codon:yes stop_codon:yes gene_type:complete